MVIICACKGCTKDITHRRWAKYCLKCSNTVNNLKTRLSQAKRASDKEAEKRFVDLLNAMIKDE